MRRSFSIWIFFATIVLVPSVVYAVVKWYEHSFTRLPVLGPQGHTIEQFSLRNQDGETMDLHKLDDRIIVANLFFSHCPVVCPKMIRSLKTVRQYYPFATKLSIVSFSVDPERDSVSRLKQFAGQLDIGWDLLTGDKKEIYRFARKSLQVVATDGDGGPQDFIHSELLVLIDKEKRIRGYYNGTEAKEVEDLLRDISRLEREYQ